MIEDVAKAIHEARRKRGFSGPLWEYEPQNIKLLYRESARAAIETMREPTRRMVSEGESAASIGIGKCNDDEALPRVWYAMIDAALARPVDTGAEVERND